MLSSSRRRSTTSSACFDCARVKSFLTQMGRARSAPGPGKKVRFVAKGRSRSNLLANWSWRSRPPHDRDRLRWLVEKAAELEVTRIRWLRTRYGNARPNLLTRSQEWAAAALEQSRGAWLTAVDSTWVTPVELNSDLPTVAADPSGNGLNQVLPLRVMIGPEGGWERERSPPRSRGSTWGETSSGRKPPRSWRSSSVGVKTGPVTSSTRPLSVVVSKAARR